LYKHDDVHLAARLDVVLPLLQNENGFLGDSLFGSDTADHLLDVRIASDQEDTPPFANRETLIQDLVR
jgi:hypothetical protein